jgi:hypothetical protein
VTADLAFDLAIHALEDTWPMVPALFLLYMALEVLARSRSDRLAAAARRIDGIGPLFGAALGIVPQCGMSVFVTSMFLSGRVSRGTLVATYIATSDEALPVLLAHGHQGRLVLAIVGAKLLLGAAAGFGVDAVTRPRRQHVLEAPQLAEATPRPCGGHHATDYGRLARHALGRTLNIFAWVFALTLAIGIALELSGGTDWLHAGTDHPYVAVVAAGFFGLIPNCAASIALAEAAVRGLLPFGATMAGLSAGAGYGPILLLRDASPRTAVGLLLTCLVISIAAGVALTLVLGGAT